MIKILVLDVYKNFDYRIFKDTSGGYGAGNDFGNSFISKISKKNEINVRLATIVFGLYPLCIGKKIK